MPRKKIELEENIKSDISEADVIEQLKDDYQIDKEVEIEKKQRKRRTKKEINESDKNFDTFKQTLFPVSELLLTILCSRLPNPKPPTELELKMFDSSLNAVVEKYFDRFMGYSAEVGLLLATTVIIFPRIQAEKKEDVDTKINNRLR